MNHPSSVKTWAEGLLTQLEQSDNPRPKEQLELLRRQIADLDTGSQRPGAAEDEPTFEVVRSHEQLVVAGERIEPVDLEGDEWKGAGGTLNLITLAQEITLYLVHGWLHLVGYNDKSEGDRNSMRNAEKRVMSAAITAKKIPSFILRSD